MISWKDQKRVSTPSKVNTSSSASTETVVCTEVSSSSTSRETVSQITLAANASKKMKG